MTSEPLKSRISASLDNWKRNLLDLTKRNRALNFKVQKVSTVTIVDELPPEVFRHLFLREKSMRFAPKPENSDSSVLDRADASTSEDDEATEDLEDTASIDFFPYEQGRADSRHVDDILQTSHTPEQLDKSLRRLDEQTRSTLEEQGVNVLYLALGMLHYRESKDSDVWFRAPLVLLPVTLERKNARTGYTVRHADDDPMVNPALVEYLKRIHNRSLAELPDWTDISETWDLQPFFTEVIRTLPEGMNWSVKNDIHLALFSFQKFVMYKDMETNDTSYATHRLIRQMVGRNGNNAVGLPPELRDCDLDQVYPPEKAFHVVDADSSQQRALAAVQQGHDLVLEGPPGTGKSQTITNLIAQALAAGKSVLFVSEKMAALQVVYNRLVSAGFGEFCLEVHSTKANKRAVMKEIAAALDASLSRVPAHGSSAERLKTVRDTLTRYAGAVHEPHGALGLSPYQVLGRLLQVQDAPKLVFRGAAGSVVAADLDAAERNIGEMALAAGEIGDPRKHPWRDTKKTYYSERDLDLIESLTRDLIPDLETLQTLARQIEQTFGVPPLVTFGDLEKARALADVLERSPGAPLAVLENPTWNAAPPQALEMIQRVRKIAELTKSLAASCVPAVFDGRPDDDIAYVGTKQQGFLGFLSFLDERYRTISKNWKALRTPGASTKISDMLRDMKVVSETQKERETLASQGSAGRELFGSLWNGEASSPDELQSYVAWVVEFRTFCVAGSLRKKALEVAAQASPNVTQIREMLKMLESVTPRLRELWTSLGWDPEGIRGAEAPATLERVRELATSRDLAGRWAAFEQARAKVAGGLAGELLAHAMQFGVPHRAETRTAAPWPVTP